MSLGKELIAAVESSGLCDRIERVELPEVKSAVYVKTVRGDGFRSVLRNMKSPTVKADEGHALVYGCIALACDENGKAIWTAKEDFAALLKWPISMLNRIFNAGLKLNGMSEDAQEEHRKNSETTDSDDSN